jgi:hypothetical protein
MRVILAIVAAALIALVVSQLLLPGYLEGKIEKRLESHGGSAEVTLEALPAVRLLFHDGDKLKVRGQDLGFVVDLAEIDSRFLDDFDGFDEVDVRLERLRADPFRIRSFELTRGLALNTGSAYRLSMSGSTSSQDLVAFGTARLPGFLAPLIGGTAGALAPRGRIPVEIDAVVTSDDGRATVTAARGTVAGLPVGPLVELVAAAILSRV